MFSYGVNLSLESCSTPKIHVWDFFPSPPVPRSVVLTLLGFKAPLTGLETPLHNFCELSGISKMNLYITVLMSTQGLGSMRGWGKGGRSRDKAGSGLSALSHYTSLLS